MEPETERLLKRARRPLTLEDVQALQPFHWGYEFDEVMRSGGFDAILTNPPWEAWKPQAKEFFAEHSDLVTKNKMTIREFEKEQAKILRDPEIRAAWLEYLSRFPHVSLYYRTAPQYKNQIATIRDASGKKKKAGTDINLYKLFLEQCFNLLQEGGRCGILLPTGLYTDLGAKQLREMMFTKAQIRSLFGLSNEKFLFEGVHHSFRICLLTFEKGGATEAFKAAFRINPREAISAPRLESFLHASAEHLTLSPDLIRKLSPNSLAIEQFRSEVDLEIALKVANLPLLGDRRPGVWSMWNIELAQELHMTNDSDLFRTVGGPGYLPLVQGGMIHQFNTDFAPPKYYIEERAGRSRLLPRGARDEGQVLPYQTYRLVHRRIARNTDQRSMIAAVLPPGRFCADTAQTLRNQLPGEVSVFLVAVLNSFTLDYILRNRIAAHVDMHFVYDLPFPRLAPADPKALPIISRAARLVCVNADFAALWREIEGSDWSPKVAAAEASLRARLRAEVDGLVAHLYGLSEKDFEHILSTFPLISQEDKQAALEAYLVLAPKAEDKGLATLVLGGEGPRLEFKSTARWDLREGRRNGALEATILRTVAGFLNGEGGTLLIGVADDGSAMGLQHDYQTLQKKDRDGFGLFLADLLFAAAGRDLAPCVHWSFHKLAGKDVCRIDIQPSPRPVFLADGNDEVLWLRVGSSTRRLTTKEALAYEKARWGAQREAGHSTSGFGTPRTVHTSEAATAALALSPLFRTRQPEGAPPSTAEALPPAPKPAPARPISDFTRDELKEQIEVVVGTAWTSRNDAIREAARRLGFRRTGSAIREAFESAIKGALRQGRLEASADRIRRAPGD